MGETRIFSSSFFPTSNANLHINIYVPNCLNEIYLAIKLPNPTIVFVKFIPISQTYIPTLRSMLAPLQIEYVCVDEFLNWPALLQINSPFTRYFELLLKRGLSLAMFLEGVRLACNFTTVLKRLQMCCARLLLRIHARPSHTGSFLHSRAIFSNQLRPLRCLETWFRIFIRVSKLKMWSCSLLAI